MIKEHIKKIVKDSELDENSVIRKFRITTEDGNTMIDMRTKNINFRKKPAE